MATKLYINYVRKADISGEIDEIRRIHLAANCKRVHIREDDSFHNMVIMRVYDFQNATQTEGSVQVPRPGYSDNIYRYMIDADDVLHLWICCAVPLNTPLPVPDYQIREFSGYGTKTVWLANGEQDRIVSGGSAPGWVPGALTEQQKKDRVITAIQAWRTRKKAWLLESLEYADLIPEISKHLGLWLRAADYGLSELWRLKVAGTITYDWLVLEAIVKEATKGPLTLDPDGDGAYNVEFFDTFRGLIAAYPSGPTDAAAIWVNWWELTGSSTAADVARRNMNDYIYGADVSQSDRDARRFAWRPTDVSTPVSFATYNPTAKYWTI